MRKLSVVGKRSEKTIIIGIFLIILGIILVMFIIPKVYTPFNNTTNTAIESMNKTLNNIVS